MIDEIELKQQLNYFPKDIKLSYENMIHKKVFNADIMLAIPEGKKCYLWFTTYREKNICFILELDEETRDIKRIYPVNMCYDVELSFETVFYGTLFYHNKNRFFSFEDIYYYKNKNIVNMKYLDKLKLIKNIFEKEISQIAYDNSFLIVGLPIICNDFSKLMNCISQLPYDIKYIQYRYFDMKYINNLKYIKPSNFELKNYDRKQYENNNNKNIRQMQQSNNSIKNTELVFKVKAELQNDIYNLYCYHNGKVDYLYGIALIPDYKTSVMMNKLFRNIKENVNLDYLEESDSEEEFENENIDKFVNLERSYNMVCRYNQKFNKWYPIKLASRGEQTANLMRDLA